MPSIASMLPGVAENACPATTSRAGTRWRIALTVVSTTAARSRPLSRASRASAVMRCATIAGQRRGAVIGLAIPGRKLGDGDVRGEEGERAGKLRHPRPVAAHHEKARRRRVLGRGDGTGEIGQHETFGAVGDVGKGERPARREELCWRAYVRATNVHTVPFRSKARSSCSNHPFAHLPHQHQKPGRAGRAVHIARPERDVRGASAHDWNWAGKPWYELRNQAVGQCPGNNFNSGLQHLGRLA